ncbi:carbohydrate ABC transporter substrate-binding protein, CUT1 family (plasmid) [Deinococcus geothermalis DSM 11300]|uniref:Carbohydrate ABC transporter substrate-binding protein, CUT1 family n=1 Tax=Deinococcus geothermalis (strain DSM 11300 / CIP 105573 / AG-3a) TaxID=319795 RepID=Q1J2J6_DEIGD|nr:MULTISPECIES: extracellular solute-binding protein [Deinococcus]ABF44288.1 carbohydrate ABC transporter substrate-binding protein, CUT1 family [Deinococcus geothermalis DSM 11300]TDE85610.1 extracellular solute-binding protein [Deinococcus sp. S9]
MRRMLTLTLALTSSMLGLAAAQTKTITVSVFPDLDSVVKAALPGFKKLYPNIDVKINSLAYADHHTALATALSTGKGAGDVVAVDFGYIAKFAEGNGLVDLRGAPYNAGQYRSQFVAYTFPQATASDGRLVAMPTDIGPGSMFYRTDLLKKAGVRPTDLNRSWESYIAAGKKVVAANPGSFLIPDASEAAQIILRTGLGAGEGLYFDKSGKVLVSPDNPRFVRAFTIAKQIRDAKLDARAGAAFSPEWTTAFQKGNLATEFSGAWLVGHMQNWLAKDYSGKWAAQNLPGNTYASWGGSFYAIPQQSQNKAEAWALIKYLTTNPAQQVLAFKTTGAFPALRAAANDPVFNEGVPYLGGQKARILWRQAALKIQPLDVNRLDPVAEQIVNDALSAVLDGSKDVRTALTEAQMLITRRAR